MISIDRPLRFLSSIYPTMAVFYSDNEFLLCAVKYKTPFTYIVCNPVTKQWITLPEPRGHCQYNENVLLHVYNVDELCSKTTTQFMVMCFIKEPNDLLQVELYCSKKGKWNKPKLCYYSSRLKEIDCITYFKGSAYWIHDERQIAVYGLKEESVGFVELSPDIRLSAGLGVSAGVLYFIETTPKCFQVWVFENGAEFSLKHSIEFESFKERSPSHLYREGFTFHLMGFHPLDYQLVLVKCNDKVALYHMDKRSLEVVDDMNDIWELWTLVWLLQGLPLLSSSVAYLHSLQKEHQ
ncbi:hypothetical protein FRX31_024784 [Thalictrum thalictroides]|uniref:F-box protein At3g26010-like beta-propeller domain-containing protein n=1 Tax=Thalictrum thalictroides TaxID=46969 RepID=A0A7J6VN94_THATH|nr:hypothetical protein FRX31_024784 [Thalictrum thalictroides]